MATGGTPSKDRNLIATNKSQANSSLNIFTEDTQNLEKLRFVLENSTSAYSQYLAASSLKQLFTTHWSKIAANEKVGIKDYLLNFLVNKGVNSEQQVLKMVIILLAKVVKMSWFDHPEIQSIVGDLVKLFFISDKHLLVALQSIDDLIVEMSYVTKVKNLNISRRISLNFRDTALF
jgi:exportin-7